jgi:hypothetical protein
VARKEVALRSTALLLKPLTVDPAYTSWPCASCGAVDARSRESQVLFCGVAQTCAGASASSLQTALQPVALAANRAPARSNRSSWPLTCSRSRGPIAAITILATGAATCRARRGARPPQRASLLSQGNPWRSIRSRSGRRRGGEVRWHLCTRATTSTIVDRIAIPEGAWAHGPGSSAISRLLSC